MSNSATQHIVTQGHNNQGNRTQQKTRLILPHDGGIITPANQNPIPCPALLQSSEAKIMELKAWIAEKCRDPSYTPKDHEIRKFAAAEARIIDFYVAQFSAIVDRDKPDKVFLSENHTNSAHILFQTRYCWYRGETLGRELSCNLLSANFHRWAQREYRVYLTPKVRREAQNYLKTHLGNNNYMLGADFSLYALQSKKLQAFLISDIAFTDAAQNPNYDLDPDHPATANAIQAAIGNEEDTYIPALDVESANGIAARNHFMITSPVKNQQCGIIHVAGWNDDNRYKSSLLGLADQKGISTFAPILWEPDIGLCRNNLPSAGRNHPALAKSTDLISFYCTANHRDYGDRQAVERDKNAALLEIWGCDGSVHQGFTRAVNAAENRVPEVYEQTLTFLKENHPAELSYAPR